MNTLTSAHNYAQIGLWQTVVLNPAGIYLIQPNHLQNIHMHSLVNTNYCFSCHTQKRKRSLVEQD